MGVLRYDVCADLGWGHARILRTMSGGSPCFREYGKTCKQKWKGKGADEGQGQGEVMTALMPYQPQEPPPVAGQPLSQYPPC